MIQNNRERNYQLSEQIYESADKKIKIFKTRKRFSIQYLAVKVYSKSLYEGFVNESGILKSINHPHILRAFGNNEDYSYYYLELEYCLTGDLSKALMLNTKYSETIVKHIGYQIILALSHLHKQGILHCNLKPSNILIDDYGNIRLCDFKKSLKITNMNPNDVKRHKSAITPCYTAPELFSEDGIFSFKTEIWALGCILYELATGQVPFYDEGVAKLINKIINDELNFNRLEKLNFSEEFVDIIKRMLEKDPTKRFFWNDLNKQSFWEGPFPDAAHFDPKDSVSSKELFQKNSVRADSSKSIKSSSQSSLQANNGTDRKKVDILRLSRAALKNMKEDQEDEYSDYIEEKSEVKNADQEFNFENKESESERKVSESEDNMQQDNYKIKEIEKLQKANPLEMSTVAVSKIMKRNKRKNLNNYEEYEKSVLDDNITIEAIMIHPTDKIIKPIIGNKIIESTTVTTFDRTKLQFTAYKIEKIKELYQTNIKNLEQFLKTIYAHLSFYANNENDNLLNLLNYFETIIQDKEIANNIINSSFVTLLVNILKNSKNVSFKIRVCSIIGFLIRYSTVIDSPLDEIDLCRILDLCVRDKNEKLGKKAVATLGEYLFFVATQAEGEEETQLNWNISDESLSTLLWCLEKCDDEIIKFYVVKTIENISALTLISKIYFTKDDKFLMSLIQIANTTKNADLRISAVYSISHLIRLEPRLFKPYIEKVGVMGLINMAERENNKIQQALINIILNGIYKDNSTMIKNEFLVPLCNFLIKFLDNPNIVIRIKIILIFGLMFESSTIVSKFGEKLFHHLQKYRKENSAEILQAIKIFESTVQSKAKIISKNFITLLIHCLKSPNYYDDIIQYFNSFTTFKLYTKLLPLLYTQDLLEILIKIIESDFSDETIISNIFQLLSNFSENPRSVLENNDFVIRKMAYPILSACLNVNLENKILPLNIVANMINIILEEEKLYSSTVMDQGKTQLINSFIIKILPIFKEMLKKDDLVFSTLSIISIILERNSFFIRYLKQEGLIIQILNLMDIKNYSNNLNLIKISIKVIESQDISLNDILQFGIIDKINSLMSTDFGENNVYTEYIIELFYELMHRINEEKKTTLNPNNPNFIESFKIFTSRFEKVAKNFRTCIYLIGNENKNIFEKSCICLMFLLQIFGANFIESLGTSTRFISQDIPHLLKGLDLNRMKIHKRVIKIFIWMFEYQKEDLAVVLGPHVSWIQTLLENIINLSSDDDVKIQANMLNELLKTLKF